MAKMLPMSRVGCVSGAHKADGAKMACDECQTLSTPIFIKNPRTNHTEVVDDEF